METIPQILESIAETICDNFCKYRDTCDDNAEFEWIRNGNVCPLDKIV